MQSPHVPAVVGLILLALNGEIRVWKPWRKFWIIRAGGMVLRY
jgi:hypothetical protein